MQVEKKIILAKAKANLDAVAKAVEGLKQKNIQTVKDHAEHLVKSALHGERAVPVELETVRNDIEARQGFIERIDATAADERGAITITDTEWNTYVKEASARVEKVSFTRLSV